MNLRLNGALDLRLLATLREARLTFNDEPDSPGEDGTFWSHDYVRRASTGAMITWRAREAEAALTGKPFDGAALQQAADAAFADARGLEHNAFKIELGKRTLMRALAHAAAMEV